MPPAVLPVVLMERSTYQRMFGSMEELTNWVEPIDVRAGEYMTEAAGSSLSLPSQILLRCTPPRQTTLRLIVWSRYSAMPWPTALGAGAWLTRTLGSTRSSTPSGERSIPSARFPRDIPTTLTDQCVASDRQRNVT